jgi:hypothetical protein
MSYWQQYLLIESERLRLEQKVFELNCSVELLTAQENFATDEEIEILLTLHSRRRSSLHNKIDKQLLIPK